MAVNIITSGFLLLVLVAGVQSAIKDLGEACTDGTDTCVHPTLGVVCDTPTAAAAGVCRVKAGQACNDAGGLCVNGALCVSNVCTCQTATYTQASATGKCTATAAKWGATCAADGDCTANNAAKCTAGACVCTGDTFAVNYADGSCTSVAAGKVGLTCTNGGSECPAGNKLSCPASAPLRCKCDAGYYAKQYGGDCVANSASTVGKACTTATAVECTGQNEVCTTSPCACKTGFTSVSGGVCFPVKGSLKGGCSVDGDCTGGPTKCTSYNSAPMTCKTALAATTACTANPTTEACGNGLVCDTTCKTALAVGAACTANPTTAACGTGLVCDTTCKTVLPKDGDCSAANTKCGTGLTCVATKCIQSNANSVTITAFLVMAVAAVGKLMM